ncbi:MAG TPA: NADH-quinone oxidoreductase subunit J, partial [Candidatus Binatia bacterium]|nr:NADH-quinone oxidoreductase subunit J [Candidatus Binatia bacterium]
AFYLQLDAEFIGFSEILVYVGAVAILIVFAILLTRSGDTPEKSVVAPGWYYGIAVSSMVFAAIGWCVLNSTALSQEIPAAPDSTVKKIGELLMTKYVLPLEIIGLVLTAAMIGAVLIALRESKAGSSRGNEAQIKIGNQPQAAGIQLEPPYVGSYKDGIGGVA